MFFDSSFRVSNTEWRDFNTVEKKVSVQILHDSGKEEEKIPIYHHKVELYVKTKGLVGQETEERLAEGETDKEGRVTFKYKQFSMGSFGHMEKMIIKIHRTGTEGILAYLKPVIAEVAFDKPFDKIDYHHATALRAKVLEYNPKKDPFPNFMEDWTQLDYPNDLEFLKTILGTNWKSLLLSFAIKPFANWMTIEHVCKMYNITERTDFTSELLIKMITYGICIPKMEREEKTDYLIIKTDWNPKSINYSKDAPDVPNGRIFLKETKKGLELVRIDIQHFKKDGKKFEDKKPEEIYDGVISYYPKNEDGTENKDFKYPIQYIMCGLLLWAQIKTHLARHYYTEILAALFNRCIVNNPIAEAVKAPNHGTNSTNEAAKPLLTNDHSGALRETGLTLPGLEIELNDGVRNTQRPFEERFKGDKFALREACCRRTLRKGYAKFVEKNYKAITSSENWPEIYQLFEEYDAMCEKFGLKRIGKMKNKDKPESKAEIELLIDLLTDHGFDSSEGHHFIHNSQKEWQKNPDLNMGPFVYFSKNRLGDGHRFMNVKAYFAYLQTSIGIALTSIGDSLSPTRSLLSHPYQIQEIKDAIKEDEKEWKEHGLDGELITASIFS